MRQFSIPARVRAYVSAKATRGEEKPFTEAELNEMVQLLYDGLSDTEIGARLGRSRGSIAGALHRLGVSRGKASPPRRYGR